MDEAWRYYAKWNKPVTKGQILQNSSYGVRGVVKFIETENRKMVDREWRKEEKGAFFFFYWVSIFYRVSVLQEEKSSGEYPGDSGVRTAAFIAKGGPRFNSWPGN